MQRDILSLVLIAEIAVIKALQNDFVPFGDRQPHPIDALDESQKAWETFVRAECDRQYWGYYPGTIANLIWITCYVRSQKQRIDVLNTEVNDRDVKALDINKVFSSMAF